MFSKAIRYYENGLKLSNEPQYQGLYLSFSANLASSYVKVGKKKEALEILTGVLPIAVQNKFYEKEIQILLALAEVYFLDNFEAAKVYLDSSFNKANRYGDKEAVIRSLKAMSALYKVHAQYKESMAISEKERQMSDSLFNKQKAIEVADLQANHQLQKSKTDINRLELINKTNLTIRYGIILILAVILIFLFIILYFYYRSRKLNKLVNRANNNLQILNEELEEMHVVKDKMFAIIGHDLRSPLASVIGMLDLLKEDALDKTEQLTIIEQLSIHSKGSMEMLTNLLLWGQNQIKGSYLRPQYCSVKDIIAKNILLVKVASTQKSLTIEDLTDASAVVWADPSHIDFVFRNLISNAIKYSRKHGSIIIGAEPQKTPSHISFYIKDTGIGISQERLSSIFKLNGQSTIGTAGEKGTGLGLVMCKDFIEANDGELHVESEENVGSVLKITFRRYPRDY
ncbi:sensor histidine kinase [Niabella ginsengisoli]|uniref:histidine kinase n=1 Tax=Niabella ginsengisoli TaxID=522298 RepID=A0ABS9SIW9_9BACT|nr:HAMP domain-containing sensor histidine kinase [Niabella ginsengisoli]MCH5598286.1 HAMP domain-containing histidine kinase [Niabella ginsengisoli]